ncbi:MAG: hypothetical protein B7X04_03200 [Parcubacteria group bacterium 21-54-25]|nr:MAG: hypothetical protein B7X04_03200 [Parcubacteria group bacterium 21-54-25]HQU07996.1 glycosyltransferase family A protein [Candidatus Paceibacterota bacterium]
MRISFVIPAYNEETFLPKCLASVERELARTPCDAEVIVVNNASTDRTGDVARTFAWVRVVDEPHKGLVRARHAGLQVATGDIIANVDSDAILPEGWLAKVITEFSHNERLAALSGPYIYYDLSWFQRALVRVFYTGGYLSHLFNHHVLRAGAMLQGGNFVVRRAHLEQAGGFDTSIEFYGEDTDVARRISKMGRVKWTFGLPMYSSGRRLAHEGVVTTGLRYAANYFHTLLRGRPLTTTYVDIRPEAVPTHRTHSG